METSSDDVPQLEVETEHIRRKSGSLSESKASIDLVHENTFPSLPSIPAADSYLDIPPAEPNMKRIDSDSKFGHMETIPLELSGQEPGSSSGNVAGNIDVSGCDEEKLENSPLHMRSFSLNERDLQPNRESAFMQRTQSVTGSDTTSINSISKYFTSDDKKVEYKDSKGVEFFNALASDSRTDTTSIKTSEIFPPVDIKEKTKVIELEKNTEIGQEVLEDANIISEINTSNKNEDYSCEPLPLSTFFAEDKSGTDRDGKAFFDKIAEDTDQIFSPGAAQTMPSSITSPPNQFLVSPTISGEIEDAWIPSDSTRQILVAMITSAPGSFTPDKKQLTMPGVIVDDEMSDPIKSLLIESNSSQVSQRRALTADDVTQNEDGLRRLIEVECYHAAINLTKRLLRTCGQGPGDEGCPSKHTPISLRLWYTRLALLVKLRKFSIAEVESSAFGDFDRPDLYYEFYPDMHSGKKGTMVPFSLRILLAELPQYQGNHQIALDNLHRILNIIEKIIYNLQNGCAEDGSMIELSDSRRKASLSLWGLRERRVLYSILNCVLSLKDYVLAVSTIKILIEKDTEHASELHSALGRIYLQLGDVKYAQIAFAKAAAIPQEKSGDVSCQVEDHINKALLAVALDNNEEAYKYYQQAYVLRPDSPMLANNMAVCLLYMGRLKESLALLEKAIQSQPSSCLHDGILFNTCTLYELESSHCTQKKLAMLDLVSKYVGDGFRISCLKIQPMSKG